MLKKKDLQILEIKKTDVSNVHPLEVVGRGSDTELQVGENLNYQLGKQRVEILNSITNA